MTAVYGAAAHLYVDLGWPSPLPVPPRAKDPAISGYTGYDGIDPNRAQIARWVQTHAEWNLTLRMPPGVIGIDVDMYDGKAGQATLAKLETDLGVLPRTYASSSRDDGSGIWFFRVPAGMRFRDHPGGVNGGIELIQRHQRYAVVWPSIHPEGRPYRWFDESAEEMDGPPDVGDLAPLPLAWIEALKVTFDSNHADAATVDTVRAFLDEHQERTHPTWLDVVRCKLRDYTGSRHDHLVSTACWTMREAAAGLYPARDAVFELKTWWDRVIDDPHRRDGVEFADAIAWAVAQAIANPAEVDAKRKQADEFTRKRSAIVYEPAASSDAEVAADTDPTPGYDDEQPTLPESFWSLRPEFEHIRTAAHSRMLAPDAVLGSVLARVVTLTDHRFVIPPVVSRHGSLNLFVALPAPSGQGKGSTLDTAAELVPADGITRFKQAPAGSGEGTVKAFFDKVPVTDDDGKTKRDWSRVVDSLLLRVDEGTLVKSLAQRTGQTTLETWRSAWSGEELGGTYADPDRRGFILHAHDYRLCIVMGVQPTLAQFMFDDTDAGTPQRFLWLGLVDPRLPEPDNLPDWPGPLRWSRPMWGANGVEIVAGRECGVLTVHPDVTREIRVLRHRVATGMVKLDPLNGHEHLSRLKIAGVLSVLDGRVDIDTEDWRLAGIIQNTSNEVRAWTRRMIAGREQAAEQAGLERVARRAAAQEAGKTSGASNVERIARLLARYTTDAGADGLKRSELYRKLASRDRRREFFDAAVAFALDQRWLAEREGRLTTGEATP